MSPDNIPEPTRQPDDSEPRKRRRGRAASVFVIFMALAILTGIGFAYRDFLTGTRLGELVGLTKTAQTQTKVIYYCPMHPNYHSDKPGTCPICNMTLEKLEPGQKLPSSDTETASSAQTEQKPQKERKPLYWVDPMDPKIRSDKPGKAPCGMDLVPVYADEGAGSENLPPGTVKISPQKQQLIGVIYADAVEENLSKTIRAVGRVTYDETKLARIQAKIEGWIDKVFVDFTGGLVKKGQALLTIYSPQLVSTQNELLIAKKTKDYLGKSTFKDAASGALSLYQSTVERLKLWDISDAQIKEIEKRGTPTRTMTLSSPINGFVTARNAFPGQRITPETELYTIADLSTIWVMADIYEYEIPLVKLGQTAVMTLDSSPGKTYKGKVTYIYPELDRATRTLKVRLEFPNPDFKLKPDMYATVEIKVDFPKQVSIPQEAVLDSGEKQIVFVARDEGTFEPRKVELGARVGDRYIVTKGLKAGEKVVASGNFLIDSESQLKSAMGGMDATPDMPGMSSGSDKKGGKAEGLEKSGQSMPGTDADQSMKAK